MKLTSLVFLQRTAGKSTACAYGTVVRQGARTATGGHVPEGAATTTQVQDSDETTDEVDGERSGTLRVSSRSSRRPRHGGRVVQGRRSIEARSVVSYCLNFRFDVN